MVQNDITFDLGSVACLVPELKDAADASLHFWRDANTIDGRLVAWVRAFGDQIARFGNGFGLMVDELLFYHTRVYSLYTHILHVLVGKARLRCNDGARLCFDAVTVGIQQDLDRVLARDRYWAARLQVARACMLAPNKILLALFGEMDEEVFFTKTENMLGRPITWEGTISRTCGLT
jgi:hypothetical protein